MLFTPITRRVSQEAMPRNSTTAVIWDMDGVIADTDLIVDTLDIQYIWV